MMTGGIGHSVAGLLLLVTLHSIMDVTIYVGVGRRY
jgi:hypothetical protein